MNTYHYESPVGILEIKTDSKAIISLKLVENQAIVESDATPLIKETCAQLDEYFAGKRLTFDLPLSPKGTPFQETVWKQLQEIPYSQTISYAQLAKAIHHPKACRAVGSANGKNPIAIIIPCHRVIASGGGLGGYAYGIDIKKQLLDLEQNV